MIQIEPGTPETSKPTVLIENLFADGTLVASSEAANAQAANAVDGKTFDFWTPTVMPATFTVTLGASDAADCLCFAAHNLGSQGATLTLEQWDGGGWIAVATVAPTDDSTIMVLFPEVSSDQWRLNISGATAPSIGQASLGKRIVMPVGIVGDYTPTDWGERLDLLGGKTRSGQFLGQRIRARGAETTVNIGRMDRSWYLSTGRVFQSYYNSGQSFFFAGWPNTLPNDVAMCWRPPRSRETHGRITEQNWAAFSFDVECYVPTNVSVAVVTGDNLELEGDVSGNLELEGDASGNLELEGTF